MSHTVLGRGPRVKGDTVPALVSFKSTAPRPVVQVLERECECECVSVCVCVCVSKVSGLLETQRRVAVQVQRWFVG